MSARASFRLRELARIGKGGMGTTYLACAKASGGFERFVVVKRLHQHLVDDETARRRLLQEAELAACVHHANVVPVHYAGVDEGGAYLVMDYVEGASLRQLAKSTAPNRLPLPVLLRVCLDALAGLEAIHSARDHQKRPLGILHRDISPDNIMVGIDGFARLADFGIAKTNKVARITAPSQILGKTRYLAPEYIDRGETGPAMDVYAMGVTLWTLAVGNTPWAGLEEAQILVRALTTGIPDPPTEASLPSALVSILRTACAIEPGQRFESAALFRAAVEALDGIGTHRDVATFVQQCCLSTVEEFRTLAAASLNMPSEPPPPISLEPTDIEIPRVHDHAALVALADSSNVATRTTFDGPTRPDPAHNRLLLGVPEIRILPEETPSALTRPPRSYPRRTHSFVLVTSSAATAVLVLAAYLLSPPDRGSALDAPTIVPVQASTGSSAVEKPRPRPARSEAPRPSRDVATAEVAPVTPLEALLREAPRTEAGAGGRRTSELRVAAPLPVDVARESARGASKDAAEREQSPNQTAARAPVPDELVRKNPYVDVHAAAAY